MDFLKEIPKEVWGATVEVINKLIYPITATTVGVGKLIEQKFSTLTEIQKIIAEQTLREAAEKVSSNKSFDFKNVSVKPQVIYMVLENTEQQCDDFMRSLWVNLTAKELSEGSVHPEIARIFSRLTATDVILLSELYAESSTMKKMFFKVLASTYTLGILGDKKSFHHVHLSDLGLVAETSGKWFTTTKGEELLRCVRELEKGS